jgi:hypothetical protein
LLDREAISFLVLIDPTFLLLLERDFLGLVDRHQGELQIAMGSHCFTSGTQA